MSNRIAPEKERQLMSLFEKFITEGNECNVGRRIYGAGKSEHCPAGKRRIFAVLQYAVSFQCLVEEWKMAKNL